MSSIDNIYSSMAPNVEPTAFASMRHEQHADSPRQIGREVAHDLNNVLTIIRGYTERLVMKHAENPVLRPDLNLIVQNIKRAESLVRHSTYPRTKPASTVSASSAA